AGGGYLAMTQLSQFLAPKPTLPPRPIRPIAKAPAPPSGTAPAKQAQAGPGTPGPAAPAAPAAPPAKAGPPPAAPAPAVAPAEATPPPAKAEAKTPAPAKAEPAKIAKAAPGEAPAAAPPPALPAQAAAAAGTFSLQVGAMVNEGNAQKLKQRLEQLGYAPVIRKGMAHLRRHVVTTGDYGDRAGAEEVAKRLAAQGIAARVTPAAAGRFSVEAGSFTNEDDAIDLARELQKSNYPPRIQDQAQNATIYQVRVGSFPSRAEAQAKGAELKGKGFPYLVVKN
ncbi:MAG TPA: SPOR domain-containing protein, partial [Candidatus Sulfotelmatobacter sp.]|nr:SPOR domain-containing protein [Candidatus Sulfotelmatobacter sp.]